MGTDGLEAVLIQKEDSIGILDCAEAVGDDEKGFVSHKRRQGADIERAVKYWIDWQARQT